MYGFVPGIIPAGRQRYRWN